MRYSVQTILESVAIIETLTDQIFENLSSLSADEMVEIVDRAKRLGYSPIEDQSSN